MANNCYGVESAFCNLTEVISIESFAYFHGTCMCPLHIKFLRKIIIIFVQEHSFKLEMSNANETNTNLICYIKYLAKSIFINIKEFAVYLKLCTKINIR